MFYVSGLILFGYAYIGYAYLHKHSLFGALWYVAVGVACIYIDATSRKH
jgi:hypothetical protein